MRIVVAILACVLISSACKKSEGESENPDLIHLELPKGFTAPPGLNLSFSQKEISLGKQLFEEPLLSSDSSISCKSCHLPQLAFTDGTRISPGVEGRTGKRNTPTLTNLAWQPYFFAEGGSKTLELQVLGPLEAKHEMNLNIGEAINRLNATAKYIYLFEEAFNSGATIQNFTRAIATYERTLISGNSRVDQYLFHQKDQALTDSEKRGLELFNSSRLKCASCHSGFLFTDYSFQNTGIYLEYADEGRKLVTSDQADIGKFKVPTLRNIELTSPYMHDGSFNTLRDVIDHYKSGGKAHPNKSPLITGFEISEEEINDLINFLKALTDSSFVNKN